MAEYHVMCDIDGIYIDKSNVTKEAINAVAGYMYLKVPDGEKAFAYGMKTKDGKYLRLKIEVADECPTWAKEQMGESTT